MTIVTSPDIKNAIASVYTKPVAEVLSPATCILIEQVDSNKTQVKFYEPGKAWHSRIHVETAENTGGTIGTTHLVDASEILVKVNNMSKFQTLTFKKSRGVLTLNADYKEREGKSQMAGRTSIRQYGGPTSDFPSIVKSNNLIAKIKASDFYKWLSLKEFGDFTEKSEGSNIGRTVAVTVTNNSLTGLTNYKGAYMSYMNMTIEADTYVSTYDNAEFSFGLEGLQLKKLYGLIDLDLMNDENVTQYIEVYEESIENGTQLVTFSSNLGYSTFRAEDPERRYQEDKQLFKLTPTGRVKDHSSRAYEYTEFSRSVDMMKTSTQDSNEVLLTEEEFLKCSHAGALSDTDWARIDQIDSYTVEEWTPILVNGPALTKTLKVIGSFLKTTKAEDKTILSFQRYVQRSTSKVWLLYLEPQSNTPDFAMTACIICKEAELNLEDIEDTE